MIKNIFSVILLLSGFCAVSSDGQECHREVPSFFCGKVYDFYEAKSIPHEIKMQQLRGGMSTSVIFRLDYEQVSYVVRLLFPNIGQEQRVNELIFHEEFASRGVAPKIVYVDDKTNPYMIVMEYIEGRNFDPILDSSKPTIMKQIAQSMQVIHKSQLRPSSNKSLIDQIRAFQNAAVRFPSCFEKLRSDLLAEAENYTSEQFVPVHGDLSRWNIIISDIETVLFIDFQEARMDSIYSEIGYFFYESGIDDPKVQNAFLKEYFERDPAPRDLDAIRFYMKATAFACGIYLSNYINPKFKTEDLDEIFMKLAIRGIDYFKGKHYDKFELSTLSDEEKAEFVLSHFKYLV